jgi:hypothetical protein
LTGRLESVLRQMVLRSYPELRRFRVGIAFEDLESGDCLQCYTRNGRFRIAVSPLLRDAPRRALEGGLAHELAHVLRDCRLGPFSAKLSSERIAASRSYRLREERATDLTAIERGYGPHLMELVRFARRLGIRFYRENGLLPEEIARLSRMRKGLPGDNIGACFGG